MNLGQKIKGISNRAHRYINERRGWTTDRKIIVIESDDWGAIRMPNKKVYNRMLKNGVRVDKCNYCINDTIADKTDLEHLFQTLTSIKNANGQSPKITANTIVANPDFDKIKKDNYEIYHFETIEETFKRYPNRSLKCWNEGVEYNVFKPQLHGREHVNIEKWLKALRGKSHHMLLAFENDMYGLSSSINNERISYLEALNISDEKIKAHINDAVNIFQNLFGYSSETFIAPNYCWNQRVEKSLKDNKILGIQGGMIQRDSNKSVYHYLGERNKLGQYYLTRNVLFEPTLHKRSNLVKEVFTQIEESFKRRKPAIICSHRLNFIGALNEKNRVDNLKLLSELMTLVLAKYPTVEFMFSDELFKLIQTSSK